VALTAGGGGVVLLNPKGGEVNILNSHVRYGSLNSSLLLRQEKRVS
jgi:hypothetical protein